LPAVVPRPSATGRRHSVELWYAPDCLGKHSRRRPTPLCITPKLHVHRCQRRCPSRSSAPGDARWILCAIYARDLASASYQAARAMWSIREGRGWSGGSRHACCYAYASCALMAPRALPKPRPPGVQSALGNKRAGRTNMVSSQQKRSSPQKRVRSSYVLPSMVSSQQKRSSPQKSVNSHGFGRKLRVGPNFFSPAAGNMSSLPAPDLAGIR
jgi:hypothetical protein